MSMVNDFLQSMNLRKGSDLHVIAGDPPRPRDVHPAQPFRPNPIFHGASIAARLFAPFSLLILVAILVVGSGSLRSRGSVSPPQLVQGFESEPFRVEDADSLVALDLRSGVSNAWGFFDIALRQVLHSRQEEERRDKERIVGRIRRAAELRTRLTYDELLEHLQTERRREAEERDIGYWFGSRNKTPDTSLRLYLARKRRG